MHVHLLACQLSLACTCMLRSTGAHTRWSAHPPPPSTPAPTRTPSNPPPPPTHTHTITPPTQHRLPRTSTAPPKTPRMPPLTPPAPSRRRRGALRGGPGGAWASSPQPPAGALKHCLSSDSSVLGCCLSCGRHRFTAPVEDGRALQTHCLSRGRQRFSVLGCAGLRLCVARCRGSSTLACAAAAACRHATPHSDAADSVKEGAQDLGDRLQGKKDA
jgi:hypothetical protein